MSDKPKRPDLPLPGEEAIELGVKYAIVSVEEFKSDQQGFLGWRVVLDGGSDKLFAIALWTRDIVGRRSKLGSFIEKLGNEPDDWPPHVIKFVMWADKNREIELVK